MTVICQKLKTACFMYFSIQVIYLLFFQKTSYRKYALLYLIS
uniref:Uncharacterized protein n=1 Tax=Rhizophora mucronata TaxID=61149 RepID=A0A2P2NJG4_RHIMU